MRLAETHRRPTEKWQNFAGEDRIVRAAADEQLSAFLANKPGMIAGLCQQLSDAGVTIRAMAVLDTVDIGTVRMVVDNVEAAKEALNHAGAAYVSVPVICIPIPNRPGGFGAIARCLGRRDINIDYFYATSGIEGGFALGVFRVSDRDRALEIDFPE